MLAKDLQRTMREAPIPPGLNIISANMDHRERWIFLLNIIDFMRLFKEYTTEEFNAALIFSAEWKGCTFQAVQTKP